MKTMSVDEAKETLGKLVEEAATQHEPVHIKGKGVSAVLLNEEDWRAIQETIYLLSVPGIRESIREGLATPISECSEGINW